MQKNDPKGNQIDRGTALFIATLSPLEQHAYVNNPNYDLGWEDELMRVCGFTREQAKAEIHKFSQHHLKATKH